MKNKIYVGNLSYDVSEGDLRSKFEEFGKIEDCKLIVDRETSRSKGFGFITFSSEEEAGSAVSAANGEEWSGRALRVNIAEERGGRGGRGNNFGGRGNRGGRGGNRDNFGNSDNFGNRGGNYNGGGNHY